VSAWFRAQALEEWGYNDHEPKLAIAAEQAALCLDSEEIDVAALKEMAAEGIERMQAYVQSPHARTCAGGLNHVAA